MTEQSIMSTAVVQQDGFRYVNDAYLKLTGYSREEVFAMSIADTAEMIHPDFREFVMEQGRKKMAGETENTIDRYTYLGITKDGEQRWVEQYSRPIMWDGKPADLMMLIDITPYKTVETALKVSQERFRMLVEETPLAIALIDKKGRYKYINPRFTKLFGYTLDDVSTGKEWFKRAYPDDVYRREVMKAWLEDQKQIGVWKSRPRFYRVRCKDGSSKDIHFRPVTLESNDQLVIYEDITEKLEMEQQFQQAQKFEAIGTLAGGVAHDFNNLLMGIQGRTSLMALELDETHPHMEHIDAIESYIKSASDLTKQLLGFARGGKYEVGPIDINAVVLDSGAMFGRTKKEIRIHTHIFPDPIVVEADRRQIEQVLLNLYVNAWQAMPGGGEICISKPTLFLRKRHWLVLL